MAGVAIARFLFQIVSDFARHGRRCLRSVSGEGVYSRPWRYVDVRLDDETLQKERKQHEQGGDRSSPWCLAKPARFASALGHHNWQAENA